MSIQQSFRYLKETESISRVHHALLPLSKTDHRGYEGKNGRKEKMTFTCWIFMSIQQFSSYIETESCILVVFAKG